MSSDVYFENDYELKVQTQGPGVYSNSKKGAPNTIPNQLAAFEKLQRHAINKFSKDRVYSMLKTVVQHLKTETKQAENVKKTHNRKSPENEESGTKSAEPGTKSAEPGTKSAEPEAKSAEPETNDDTVRSNSKSPEKANSPKSISGEQSEKKMQPLKAEIKIQSVRQVRDVIKVFQQKEKQGTASESEINAVKNFETFMNDLSYLKQLKEYFGENINKILYRHYFDATDFASFSNINVDKVLDRGESPPGKTKTQKGRRNKAKKEITEEQQLEIDKVNLSRTARDLQEIQNKWHGLMLESDLNLDYFDQDSHYELMQFAGYTAFEPVLRLVPDVFVKCYKSIELAREWWSLAQKVYKDRLPLNWAPSPIRKSVTQVQETKTKSTEEPPENEKEIVNAELDRQTEHIQKHISEIGQSIEMHEQKLETIEVEMHSLAAREMRSDSLTSTCEIMDLDIRKHEEEHRKCVAERQKVKDEAATTKPGTPKNEELLEKIKKLDADISKEENLIKMKQFERSLKQEDYLIELEIKPSFIIFVADMKDQMSQIKQDVVDKKFTKLKLERQLSLIQSNTEKMKDLLQRYIKSAKSRENPELTRDFTKITRELEEDLQSLRSLESRGSNITITTDTDVSLSEYLPDTVLDDDELDPWERPQPARKAVTNKTKPGKSVPKNNFNRKGSRSKILQEA